MKKIFSLINRSHVVLLASISLSMGQSLVDQYNKNSSLREMQFQATNNQALDSVKANYARSNSLGPSVTKKSTKKNPFADSAFVDSLLSGPQLDSLDSIKLATAPENLRYGQKLFLGANSSVFTSDYQAVGRSYLLGAGDKLTLSLWGDKETEYSLQVNASGKVFIEGIGLVQVEGYTVEKAEDKIRKKLAQIYSGISRGTTFAEISEVQSGPIKVFILGEAEVPGGYVFAGNTSILSALYRAKGPSKIGTERKIKLTRGSDTYYLDLYEYLLKGNPLKPNKLLDGDVLFLGRAETIVQVLGDVGRPGKYELKAKEGLKELLEFAGGLNPTAAEQGIQLTRIMEKGRVDYLTLKSPQEYLSGKATFSLRDGDIVKIDTSTEISQKFFKISGPVKYPGSYQIEGIQTVREAIQLAGGLKEEAFIGRVHVVRTQPNGKSQLIAYSLEDSLKSNFEGIQVKGRDHIILYNQKDMMVPDSVEIAGSVFFPGKYPYSEGMTVKDLILKSGGFLPEYLAGSALCYRPKNKELEVDEYKLVLGSDLRGEDQEFKLLARDFVFIPRDRNFYEKEIITISGEFKSPGKYALLKPGEKLRSFIMRTGGFTEEAYSPGFRFFRKKDSVGRIGLNLKKALAKESDLANITLEDGDSLYIPKRQLQVKVIGEVGFPSSVLYTKGKDVKYYIKRAGGYTRFSDRKNVILEYANGATTGNGDFYEDPDPGSTIYVPYKEPDPPIQWGAVINGTLGTLGTVALLIISVITIREKL